MELYQLKTFAAVAETGPRTRAAERLHISQPAVSPQIKALEEKLEVRLFERGPGGMTLTRAGARLLEEAAKVLAAAEELRNLAKALTGEIASGGLKAARDGSFDASFYVGELVYPGVAGLALREMTFRVVAPAAWAGRVR